MSDKKFKDFLESGCFNKHNFSKFLDIGLIYIDYSKFNTKVGNVIGHLGSGDFQEVDLFKNKVVFLTDEGKIIKKVFSESNDLK